MQGSQLPAASERWPGSGPADEPFLPPAKRPALSRPDYAPSTSSQPPPQPPLQPPSQSPPLGPSPMRGPVLQTATVGPNAPLPGGLILPFPRGRLLPTQAAVAIAAAQLQQKRIATVGSLGKGPGGVKLSPLEELSDELLCHVLRMGKWNAQTVADVSCASKRLAAAARVTFWREFCVNKAPKMTSNLVTGSPAAAGSMIEGGWAAYSKLMRFCPGAHTSPQFEVKTIHNHEDRLGKIFSKSGGKRMLDRHCKKDTLYVSETCEHLEHNEEVGIFRGMIKKFSASRTRRLLEQHRVCFEDGRRCPYCAMAVWSLAAAELVGLGITESLKCAEDEEGVADCDVFVCLQGHLHGMCILEEPDAEGEGEGEGGSNGEGSDGKDE